MVTLAILLLVAGVLLTLRAVGNIVLKLDGLATQVAVHAEENLLQHRVTRRYVGGELIEKRVLPAVGYREPEPTPFERKVLRDWNTGSQPRTAGIDAPTPL